MAQNSNGYFYMWLTCARPMETQRTLIFLNLRKETMLIYVVLAYICMADSTFQRVCMSIIT